jgi:hypothetical protein
MEEKLIFTQIPAVMIASNFFICQIPIRYKDEPMLEFIKELTVYRSKIPIYHSDGTKLADVKGSEIYPTEDGKKAGITMRHPAGATVCEMNGKPLFEIQKQGANALKMVAELFTFDGFFLKWSAQQIEGLIHASGGDLKIGGSSFSGCSFQGPVGIQIGDSTKPLPACLGLSITSEMDKKKFA